MKPQYLSCEALKERLSKTQLKDASECLDTMLTDVWRHKNTGTVSIEEYRTWVWFIKRVVEMYE